jgi:hypothetical protein
LGAPCPGAVGWRNQFERQCRVFRQLIGARAVVEHPHVCRERHYGPLDFCAATSSCLPACRLRTGADLLAGFRSLCGTHSYVCLCLWRLCVPALLQLEPGVDPKSVLCEFFKAGCCEKGDK